MSFAEHNNVVAALASDRTDQPKISGTFWKRRRVTLDQNVYYC
jgi:hypothetical protein